MRRHELGLLLVVLSAACAQPDVPPPELPSEAAPVTPPTGAFALEGEFRVNTFTTGHQGYPSVAVAADGSFVAVWQSFGQDGNVGGVFAQRFTAGGRGLGSEFQVNTYTTYYQLYPLVASDAAGHFVVAWSSRQDGRDGGGYGVFAQAYDADGLPLGSEFQVNSHTTGHQFLLALASNAAGDFVVAWRDWDTPGAFARRYDGWGVAQGSEFQVSSLAATMVATNDAGDAVVVSEGVDEQGSGIGVFARLSDAKAAELLGAKGDGERRWFQVNTYTTGRQGWPVAAIDANGNFVVAWSSRHQDGSGYGVFAQLFDGKGGRRGSEFQVNSYTTNDQVSPFVALDRAGNFVVTWDGGGQDGGGWSVSARCFDAAGTPRGVEFVLNSYTTGNQWRGGVTALPDGSFLALWYGHGAGDPDGVFGRPIVCGEPSPARRRDDDSGRRV